MRLQKTEERKKMGMIIQVLCLCTEMILYNSIFTEIILLSPTDFSEQAEPGHREHAAEKQGPNDLSAAFSTPASAATYGCMQTLVMFISLD